MTAAVALRLIDTLIDLVGEENSSLAAGERVADRTERVASKARLADQLAAALRDVKAAGVTAEAQGHLVAALERFRDLMAINDRLLRSKRQVTEQLVGAILAEGRRSLAATVRGYAGDGRTTESHRAAALVVDTSI